MSANFPMVQLSEVVLPIKRAEVPAVGTIYRQIGVKLWGRGVYERESIDGSQTKYKTFSRVEADDIIVNKIWARNGSVAVVPNNLAGCYASSEFPTFVPIREKLDSRWFHWLTKTKDFWKRCDEKSRGTSGKNRIRPKRFLEIEIPLPLPSEQSHIVARIEKLTAKIEEARKLQQQAMKETEILVETKFHFLLVNPKQETQLLPFTNIARLERRPVVVEPEGMYREIGIYSHGRGIFHKTPKTGFEIGKKNLYKIKNGDIILQITFAWEGAVALAGPEEDGLYGSVRFPTFRTVEKICNPRYLLMYLKTADGIAQLKKISPGSAGRNRVLSIKRLREVLIPVLPLKLQQQLMDELQVKVDTLKLLQAETAAKLDAMTPSILDKAFKGELV